MHHQVMATETEDGVSTYHQLMAAIASLRIDPWKTLLSPPPPHRQNHASAGEKRWSMGESKLLITVPPSRIVLRPY
jgi:hypothetical protein